MKDERLPTLLRSNHADGTILARFARVRSSWQQPGFSAESRRLRIGSRWTNSAATPASRSWNGGT